ncbi:cohesin complex subunit SCC1, partial [Tremellales sp. Uapishka_1]
MLLTELLLSKRGPLAKVWLSAHHERKLSKQQALGVDVEESVDAILTQETEPIALRLSGQLMLGVVRIYSRKVQYLFDDCREARERITLAFRPGVVDLPEDQLKASKNAITFADAPNDLDILDWSFAIPSSDFVPLGLHTAPASEINLRPSKAYGAYNFGRPAAPSIYGGSSRYGSHDREGSSTDGLDSQEFDELDLGLDLGVGDDSIEFGRDALEERSRSGSVLRDRSKRASTMDRGSNLGLDLGAGFEPMDLGLDMGGDAEMELPVLEDERGRRETSGLSTPPPLSPPDLVEEVLTVKKPKVKKVRLLHADQELELADEDFLAPNGNDSALLREERYIPADSDILRLEQTISSFLPSMTINGQDMIYAGPLGLTRELEELFAFPRNILRRDRGELGQEQEQVRASKRQRTREPEPVEEARRESLAVRSEIGDAGIQFDDSFDFGAQDQSFDIAPPGAEAGPATPRARAARDASFVSDVFREGEDASRPLAVFDAKSEQTQSHYGSEFPTPAKSVVSTDSSKNTRLAMNLLQREIENIEHTIQFEAISKNATKKAASAFFFELLVLGTRDCVRLTQEAPFGDIEIGAKEKLFEL